MASSTLCVVSMQKAESVPAQARTRDAPRSIIPQMIMNCSPQASSVITTICLMMLRMFNAERKLWLTIEKITAIRMKIRNIPYLL